MVCSNRNMRARAASAPTGRTRHGADSNSSEVHVFRDDTIPASQRCTVKLTGTRDARHVNKRGHKVATH